MALLIGGVSMGDQIKALEKGVDVLIATPGRLMDLFGRGKILLTGCSLLVIDEADRMLDMGFIPDIEEICTKLPKQRQTLLFSATMPPPIKKLADKFLSNPKTIEVARPATANVNIKQWLVPVAAIATSARRCASCSRAEDVTHRDHLLQPQDDGARAQQERCKRSGFRSGEIHGDMEQSRAHRRARPVQGGRRQHPGRLRRRRARARHQGRQPRLQFRRAVASRTIMSTASAAPAAPARPASPTPSSRPTMPRTSPISRS